MYKIFLTLSFFLLSATLAHAQASLSLSENEGQLSIKIDADNHKIAAFKNNKSLWLVSEDINAISLNLPTSLRQKYAIDVAESLKVNGGSGARIQFKNSLDYQLKIVDKAKTTTSISVISLKEGLVLSGIGKTKILTVSSPLLKKSFSVVPFTNKSAQPFKKHSDGSLSIKTEIGYVFESKNGGALRSLYKGRQQFLADNNASLLAMSEYTPKKRSVLTTKRDNKKITIKTTPLKLVKAISNQENNINNEPIEALSVSKFALVQQDEESYSTTKIDPYLKEDKQLVSTPTLFIKDKNALSRALKKIKSARQKMSSITAPMSLPQTEENKVKYKKFAVKKSKNDFSAFFGNQTSDISDEIEDVSYQNKPLAKLTEVEEVPSVENIEEATAIAMQVLAGTGTLKSYKKHDEIFKNINNDDDDSDFEIPDLDPNEPIFQVYGDGSEKDFQLYQYKILQAIANAPSQIKRQQYRLRLAKLYFSYQRAYEVLMTMGNMPKYDESEQLRDTSARILSGAANLVINRPQDALFYLEKKSENFEADRKLWLAVAYEMSDDDEKALDLFPDYLEQANDYPPFLIKEVYVSYGRLLLRQEHLSELKKIMQTLGRKIKKTQLPPEALILLARASIIERDDDTAETLLAQVAAGDNLEASFLAQYEFVSFLLKRGDLGRKQAIEHLENLRYLWRGDMVEEEILIKLGHMYIAKGDQRKGLERLKYHNIYFPNSKRIPKITNVMTSAFTELYLDETAGSELDPLALLGLYYDFRELTPSGKEGDQLIAQIGERLRKLGLFDQAIKVLEHQLKFRVKDEELKGVMGRNLAQLYLLNQKYNDSLMALNRTESPHFEDRLNRERLYIEIEDLIGLKKYDKAVEGLKDIQTTQADKLRAKIGWIQEKYTEVVKSYQRIFDDSEKLPYKWTEEEKVNFVQLAVAYNNLGEKRELESLKRRFKTQISQDGNIEEVIDFLLHDQGSDMASSHKDKEGLWGKLTAALVAYHDFSRFYEGFVADRKTDRRDKDVFNRRMRQMSAPPRF